ncbi:MAG: relaxase [Bacteroidales bacterium]|nr:relaxase [Bacteroidales bacterium]MCM1146461.1 relaxase [Bacteroidales bacterium]MCM1205101.1 relaxase [Bacillota bacterium]MCM1509347.1 hypothetical protein [Clostridium sp.]
MIGKAISVSYGYNCIQYIKGESRNKKHPEKICHVKDNLLPEGLDAYSIWFKMNDHARMRKNVIHVEISPAKEHTQNFTMNDWLLLWDDFVREYDNIELKKNSTVYSHKTNLAGSMATVWLHLEADSGIPHLHGAVCRKDEDGMTNNDHHISRRAQMAAEKVAMKRGWTTAAEIHGRRIEDISADCVHILKSMPKWNWNDYVKRLQAKGYKVNAKFDRKSVLRGYSIAIGNSTYKASELGKGRNLMASRIERTWQKFHPNVESTLQPDESRDKRMVTANVRTNGNQVSVNDATTFIPDYTKWHEDTQSYDLTHDNKQYRFYIPKDVMDVFNNEFDYRNTFNWKELTDLSVAVFVGLTALDTVSTGGGGGGASNDDGWRDRKDEDEMERARRCAHIATDKIGKIAKTGRRR